MKRKYTKPGQAEKVCGALKKRFEGSLVPTEPARNELGARTLAAATEDELFAIMDQKKVMTYEDNGKMFLKVWLVDGSVNYNHWGVKAASIPHNINTAIGKPVITYVNTGNEPEPWRRVGEFDHPYINDKDYHHALAYQDIFRVATYIDVQEKNGAWWGIAEITDDGMQKALREDPDLPIFVSPTIRLLQPLQDEQQMEEWEFMHSAIVDRPAYGVKKAFINGQCSGDQQTCVMQLRKASIADHGYGCPFCTYQALLALGDTSQVASDSNNSSKNIIMSAENKGKDKDDGKETFAERQLKEQEKAAEKDKQMRDKLRAEEIAKDEKTRGKDTTDEDFAKFKEKREQERKQIDIDEKRSASELIAEIKRIEVENASLRTQLKTKESDLEALTSLQTQQNDRLASLEAEREKEKQAARLTEITSIVNGSLAYRDTQKEVKDKQIEGFHKSSMSLEQIRDFITPIEQNFRKASINARSGSYRSSLNDTIVDSKSASIGNTDDPEERKPRYLQFAERRLANGGVEY